MDEDCLGVFEQLVLMAVMRLRDEAYGMTVRQELDDRTGRSTSLGAVYSTLERLEAKGYLTSRSGEATAERKGRARRFFRVEPSGLAALQRTLRTVAVMAKGLRELRPQAE